MATELGANLSGVIEQRWAGQSAEGMRIFRTRRYNSFREILRNISSEAEEL